MTVTHHPGRAHRSSPSVAARTLLAAIALYRAARAGRPSPCRFDPSCSTYARDAVMLHGAVRGGWLAARRLGRCHPWGRHGWDPVPNQRPRTHDVISHARSEVEA